MLVVPNAEQLIEAGCGVVAVGATDVLIKGDDGTSELLPNAQVPADWDRYIDAVCGTCGGRGGLLRIRHNAPGSRNTLEYDGADPCPDCHDGKPWETLYEEVSGWPEIPVDLDPVARASGFRVLPIVGPNDSPDRSFDQISVTERHGVFVWLDTASAYTTLPVDDPASVVGQFALWADRIEAP